METSLQNSLDTLIQSLITQICHTRPPPDPYHYGMDPYERWHKELRESDRDPVTKSKYRQIVGAYRTWLGSQKPSVANAKEYISHLRGKGYAQNSLLVYYHALRPFFESMGQVLRIKLRKHHTLPKYHDRDDVERIVGQAERGLYHHTEELKRRNKAIVLTLRCTGIRRGELVNLRVGDLDFHRKVIRVLQGKGHRDRTIPMSERVVVPLREQCDGKRAQDRVFAVTGRVVHKVVSKLARAAGVENFSPHSLRHFLATQLMDNGANIRAVQLILGHQSIETTAIYLDVSPRHLQETIELLDESDPPSADE